MQVIPAEELLDMGSHGSPLVVNVHKDGTAGGHVDVRVLALLQSIVGAANAGRSAMAAAPTLPS